MALTEIGMGMVANKNHNSTKVCTACNNELEAGAEFCQECGSAVPTDSIKRKKSLMRTLAWLSIPIVVLFFVVSLSSSSTPSTFTDVDWQNFNSVGGEFSVDMPCKPVREDSTKSFEGIEIPLVQYLCNNSETSAYIVQYNTYSDEFKFDDTNTQAALERGVNGIAENTVVDNAKGKITSSTFTTVNGHEAVDFVFEIQTNTYGLLVCHGRMILVGNTLYVLENIEKSFRQEQYDRFINSLKLQGS